MSTIDILAAALHAACLRDLPDIESEQIDAVSERAHLDTLTPDQRREYYRLKSSGLGAADRDVFFNARGITTSVQRRRPWPDACEVTMFRQTWPSTVTGYGGIGGQAITSTETVVVRCDHTGYAAVYFGGGRLAYLVPPENQGKHWQEALRGFQMPSCRDAKVFCGITNEAPL